MAVNIQPDVHRYYGTRLLLHNTDVRILGGVMTVVKYIVTMFTITMLLSPLIYIFTEMAAIKFPCIHSDLVVLVISIIVPYCVTIPLTEILITHSKKGK
jgi:hypothetical protein